jgi:membrane-associated phospholipid phosphatase
MTVPAANGRTPTWRAVAACALLVVLPLAVMARVGWTTLTSFDRSADRRTHTLVLAHAWLLSSARDLTHLGDPTVVTVGAVVVAALLWFTGRRRAAAYVLLVRLVAVVTAYVLKEAVRRARPVLAHPVAHAAGFSFPSGHAVGSAAFYGSVAVVLAGRVPTAVRVAIGVVPPVVVAATRVFLGVHFPSDVVAGLVVGWAVALLVAAAVEP